MNFGSSTSTPVKEKEHDPRYDAVKEKPKKAEAVEIKIELEPDSKTVTGLIIERTKLENSTVSAPATPNPNSVSMLSASTSAAVKEFSDSVMKAVDDLHVRTRDASSQASADVLAATNASSAAVLLSVGEQSDKSRMITVPVDFVAAVSDLAAQTVELTNSYSKMTQELVDPLARQTVEAANLATRDMASKLNEDVAAIVRMLMNTTV